MAGGDWPASRHPVDGPVVLDPWLPRLGPPTPPAWNARTHAPSARGRRRRRAGDRASRLGRVWGTSRLPILAKAQGEGPENLFAHRREVAAVHPGPRSEEHTSE